MNRECPTRLWLSTLLIFWAWGLSCAPTGEPDSGVAPPDWDSGAPGSGGCPAGGDRPYQ